MELIFDIGANIGNFTNECLKKYPKAKIILVEAHPELAETLKNKYNKTNCIVLNYAVDSINNNEIDFYISDDYNEISTASLDWVNNSRFTNKYKWNRIVKVKTITLDELIKTYSIPDLIKIDVENYEYQVFQGLSSKCKDICFEWTEEKYELANKCCNYLKTLGYKEFGYVDFDKPLQFPLSYTKWEESSFHNYVKMPGLKWGMIYCK